MIRASKKLLLKHNIVLFKNDINYVKAHLNIGNYVLCMYKDCRTPVLLKRTIEFRGAFLNLNDCKTLRSRNIKISNICILSDPLMSPKSLWFGPNVEAINFISTYFFNDYV